MKIDDLNCASSNYLTIFQCSFSTYIDSGCTNTNSYDATVYCCELNVSLTTIIMFIIDTTRIWNSNPYSGMIRLQGGNFLIKDVLRSTVMDSGEQYVMMDLVLLKLKLSVNNWDITITIIMITLVCE